MPCSRRALISSSRAISCAAQVAAAGRGRIAKASKRNAHGRVVASPYRARTHAAGMPWVFRLAAYARSVLRGTRWFALAALIAGGIVLISAWDAREPLRGALLLLLCLAPGAVLLHLVSVLESLPSRLRFSPGLPSRSNVLLLGVGITYLLRPWYWMAVALSVVAALVLLPLAVLTAFGLR